MSKPLASGTSTPGYAALFAFGVCIGTTVRIVRWVIPRSIGRRIEESLLA